MSQVGVLWSKHHGAYVRDMQNFTRRFSQAMRVTEEQAARLRPQFAALCEHVSRLKFEPLTPMVRASVASPGARANLADLSEEELLRRAVRGLCARDRSQAPHWALVMDALGLTSGAAVMLCRRLKIEPNQRTGL